MDEESKADQAAREARGMTGPDRQAPLQINHWIEGYDERTRKHIQFALKYADDFNHGAPGHLDLLTIAALARHLSFALDMELPRV